MEKEYLISYEDSEAGHGFSGYYYDYVCRNDGIEIISKDSGTIKDTLGD